MATHSSTLAWKIPWTEEPGGLQVHRVTQSRTQLKQLSLPTPSKHCKKSDQAKPVLLTGLLVNSFLHHLMYVSTASL